MKSNYSTLITTFLFFICVSQINAQQELLKLEDIWGSRQFSATGLKDVRSMNNGIHYTELIKGKEEQLIVKIEFKTGNTVDTLFNSSVLTKDGKSIAIDDYQFSDEETKLILTTGNESIYRHSTKANYYIYDLVTKKSTPVSLTGKQQDASLAPGGKLVAFVRDNNLFIRNLENSEEKQVTTDGKKNEIINGATDWVYEEEFSFNQGYHWSPDGSHVAYYKFNESRVNEISLTYYGELYPREEKYKYPKAGELNSTVEIYIYDVNTKKTVKTDVNKEEDQYIPRIKWTQDPSKLCVIRLNRLQNKLELYSCDATTGASSVFFTETNPAYIEISDDLTFLSNKKEFIWTSTQDGFNHIYLYDMSGKKIKQVTSGSWDVTEFYGYDESSGNYFYQAAEKSPMEKQVFSITSKGKKQTISTAPGTSSASFSKNYKYYFITNSELGSPFTVSLYFWNGKQVRVIKDNAEVTKAMGKFKLSKHEFISFTTSENISLNGFMIKPPDFNPAKKYPVLLYMYGGPNSQTVMDQWGGLNYMWFQFLAQNGYIVVSVDNRGTGARGEAFNKCTYKQLGHLETIDQIEAAKWLGKQSYVDASRIGAYGGSFGGYMSTLLITKGADYFKAAIALSPVTNWKYYDSIYTERYLQTPQSNTSGYDDNSPINFANLLKGKYLLIHGTADDNVHMQNSMEMTTALVKENKQFEVFYYPNKAHSISGVRLHLYTKMTEFLLQNL